MSGKGAAVSPTPEEAAATVHDRLLWHGERYDESFVVEELIRDSAAALDSLLAALRDACRENEILRGIAAKVMPCHYCGAETMAKCPRGFPGCSLGDDLMIADEAVTKAWGERIERAERERDQARDALASAEEFCARTTACGAIIRAALGGAAEEQT